MDMDLRYEVDGRDDFTRAIAALRKVDSTIPRDTQKEIAKAARELRKEAAAQIRAMPAEGKEGSTGIRREIAAGVKVVPSMSGGGRDGVRIITSVNEEDEAILPRGFDSPLKGWRHPVFGNKEKWVVQRGKYSWFMGTMQKADQMLIPKMEQILEDAAEFVGKSTKG